MKVAHRRAHRRIWQILAIVMPLFLIWALALRPAGPLEAPAVRLDTP